MGTLADWFALPGLPFVSVCPAIICDLARTRQPKRSRQLSPYPSHNHCQDRPMLSTSLLPVNRILRLCLGAHLLAIQTPAPWDRSLRRCLRPNLLIHHRGLLPLWPARLFDRATLLGWLRRSFRDRLLPTNRVSRLHVPR